MQTKPIRTAAKVIFTSKDLRFFDATTPSSTSRCFRLMSFTLSVISCCFSSRTRRRNVSLWK